MKIIVIIFLILNSTIILSQEKKVFFESPNGIFFTSSDLHIHTVFSDGLVWPTVRVEEALKDSLDLIAITDHIEYQPHQKDIPNPDRNRSFQLALGFNNDIPLKIIPGTEITKPMPPGHMNALFIKDANKFVYDIKDDLQYTNGLYEAKKQNAFVFWNHPMWRQDQRKDGIATLDPVHKKLIKEKLIHGIEVVNMFTFSEEALEIAIENNLTILGNSDVHLLIDWDYNNERESFHRPITFIISEKQNIKEYKKSLFDRKTFVWYHDLVIGLEENLKIVIDNNLQISSLGYFNLFGDKSKVLNLELTNNSVAPIKLLYNGEFTFENNSKLIEIKPRSTKKIYVKTKENLEEIELNFDVLNYIIGLKKNLKINKKVIP